MCMRACVTLDPPCLPLDSPIFGDSKLPLGFPSLPPAPVPPPLVLADQSLLPLPRRAHLKECFETLKRNIPNVDDKKTSNLSVLRTALRYIQVWGREAGPGGAATAAAPASSRLRSPPFLLRPRPALPRLRAPPPASTRAPSTWPG